jgi:molybdopterin-biosynthesis enzyme MoeA-like protein
MAVKAKDGSNILPSAKEMMEKLALAEAEKAEAAARKQAELEAEKKLLLDKITKASGVSDEEAMKRVAVIVNRAVANGNTEVLVYRFPNELCTDHGRAINQQEAGWEKTLTGLPKEMYEFWERRLKPLGYKLKVQIVDWPGGMPGDVGITLKWA